MISRSLTLELKADEEFFAKLICGIKKQFWLDKDDNPQQNNYTIFSESWNLHLPLLHRHYLNYFPSSKTTAFAHLLLMLAEDVDIHINYEARHAKYTEASNIYEHAGYNFLLDNTQCKLRLALMEYARGNYQKAIDINLSIIGVIEKNKNGIYTYGDALHNLGIVLSNSGDIVNALFYTIKAFHIRDELRENSFDSNRSYHNIAYMLYLIGLYGDSKSLLVFNDQKLSC